MQQAARKGSGETPEVSKSIRTRRETVRTVVGLPVGGFERGAGKEGGRVIRETIKKVLEERIPELADRVHDLPSSGQTYTGLGAVVTFGEEIRKNDWAGYRRIVKIWPYADEAAGGFDKVEELAGQIEAALHESVLGGDTVEESLPNSVEQTSSSTSNFAKPAFTCVFAGSADGDRTDAAFGSGSMTRGLRFAVYRQPTNTIASDTGEAGAELTSLTKLTSELLGSDWQIHTDRWSSAVARPCVLWRLAGSRKVTAKPSAFDVRRTYAAHVLGRMPSEEREALSRLAERLSAAQRLKPTAPGRRGATIADVVADLEADGFLKGQLRLDVLERVVDPGGRPGETDPPVLIGRVGLKQGD
ncbi:hypothetical protein [Saccharibacillus endophyticus]|uniref:Uncharacterized protein n=1 Tax=Saccharibacillus endophyticus TaxID=2060666 RepID=A0ABQ1ZUC4_9BACL|nr:hypothetical protein [Saccharibacillus endophyticus]GGH76189.1 hypothetical protein GCM10007362_18060 [Saccharibacillus endophyticus]